MALRGGVLLWTPQALRRQRTTTYPREARAKCSLESAAAGAALLGVRLGHLGELGSPCPGVWGLCPSRVARAVGAALPIMHERLVCSLKHA